MSGSEAAELVATAAYRDANQPANSDFQPLLNTQALSDQHLVSGSFLFAQGDFRSPPQEQVLADGPSNLISVETVNIHSEGIAQLPSVAHVQRVSGSNIFEVPYGVLVHELSSQSHIHHRLSSGITEVNPSPGPRQAVQSNDGLAISAETANIFPHIGEGSQLFYNSLSNTNRPFSYTVRRQTADWEVGNDNARLHPSSTTQPLDQLPYDDLQIYLSYDMDRLQPEQGAPPMETPTNAPDVPVLMYEELKQISEDPFAQFPPVDSLTGDVDMHNWSYG